METRGLQGENPHLA